VVKVAQRDRFSIYVYSELGQPHHLPHCHISWPDGESVVDLALLSVLQGDPLPGAARELLREHQAQVKRAWTSLNPGRPIS